ncbi:MAG: hypothetical protein WAU86_05785, partial [Oricola sp.]
GQRKTVILEFALQELEDAFGLEFSGGEMEADLRHATGFPVRPRVLPRRLPFSVWQPPYQLVSAVRSLKRRRPPVAEMGFEARLAGIDQVVPVRAGGANEGEFDRDTVHCRLGSYRIIR